MAFGCSLEGSLAGAGSAGGGGATTGVTTASGGGCGGVGSAAAGSRSRVSIFSMESVRVASTGTFFTCRKTRNCAVY